MEDGRGWVVILESPTGDICVFTRDNFKTGTTGMCGKEDGIESATSGDLEIARKKTSSIMCIASFVFAAITILSGICLLCAGLFIFDIVRSSRDKDYDPRTFGIQNYRSFKKRTR